MTIAVPLATSRATASRRKAVALVLALALAPTGARLAVADPSPKNDAAPAGSVRSVHVFVALADNASQGLVPVPPKIGNGEDAVHNLYWGCDEGLKTLFRRSKDWELVRSIDRPTEHVLERVVFKRRGEDFYLVADAYRGVWISRAVFDFLAASAGYMSDPVEIGLPSGDSPDETVSVAIPTAGDSEILAFIGHNGLMDFKLDAWPERLDDRKRRAVVLCCVSRDYFRAPLEASGAEPLLLTTQLMYPGSFILKAALDGWIAGESDDRIRQRAAESYAKNQGCSVKAARGLLVNGW